jgi:hypothetical protein
VFNGAGELIVVGTRQEGRRPSVEALVARYHGWFVPEPNVGPRKKRKKKNA